MRLRHLPGIATPCSALVLGCADHGTTVARDAAFALPDDEACRAVEQARDLCARHGRGCRCGAAAG